MAVDPPATSKLGRSEEPLALSRAASPRALDEIVAQERARQDGRLVVLRRLREEAERVLAAPGTAGAGPGIGARLKTLLRRRRRGPTTERELRARYEDAQLRARRALVFAETLADLGRELTAEVERLQTLLAELERDDRTLTDHLARLRSSLDPDERAARRALEVETLRDAVRAAEDRLLRLAESERMLLTRVDHLRAEVERAARDAGRRLDDLGASLRDLATRDDADRVLADLERALAELLGALEKDARSAGRDGAPP